MPETAQDLSQGMYKIKAAVNSPSPMKKLGSHIADALLEDNKVTIIDNLSSGKLENLENPNHENLTIIEEDLLSADLDEILKGKDYIFHLAALASVPKSVEEPLAFNENNIDATLKLLIAAKDNDIEYLPLDFKKKDGYKRSIALSAAFGLYRQNYCGCVYSRQDIALT